MISAEEIEKIHELRSVLRSDLLTKDRYGDDHYLIRWLRARNMDVQKAAEMLEKSIHWRTENATDELVAKGVQVPMKYRKIYPTAVLGRDEEDCLVILLPLGRFNHRILMEAEGMDNAMKLNMLWMERIMGMLKQCEEETGKKGLRIVEVVDMENYSYKELTYGPSREFILQTNRVFDENYPELLKSCIIINAPKIFSLLWNMIKPFLSKATLSKIQIYGAGGQEEENWKSILRTKLQPERVPKKWGGTRDGSDEFCSQDNGVWIDGPIPLEYFTEGAVNINGLKTDKVKARDKLVIELPVDFSLSEISSVTQPKLCWKTKVESHDVNVTISFVPKNGTETQVICPERRMDSKQGILEGSHVISSSNATGVFKLIFDNRYSLARSKTVHYSLEVVQATKELDAMKQESA